MGTVKNIIEEIISDTFSVITNVYKYQKESAPKNFTVVPPPDNSYIIFPQKADNDTEDDTDDDTDDDTKEDTKNVGSDRVSEQELRFIFVEQFNKSDTAKENGLFYSIETPTVNFYDFTGVPQVVEREEHDKKKGQKGAGRSANIDLVIYQKKDDTIKRIALIEFKARNPDEKYYRKDICKLINEESESDCLKYFIQIINNGSDFNDFRNLKLKGHKHNTLRSIQNKMKNPDELRHKTNKNDDYPIYEITYWCCNLNLDKPQKIKGTINKDGLSYKECESLSTEE